MKMVGAHKWNIYIVRMLRMYYGPIRTNVVNLDIYWISCKGRVVEQNWYCMLPIRNESLHVSSIPSSILHVARALDNHCE